MVALGTGVPERQAMEHRKIASIHCLQTFTRHHPDSGYMALTMTPLLLLALGCREPTESIDESARGDFIMGGVINTEVVDPYSYASRCPADDVIEINLRTAANEEMVISMALVAPAQLTDQTWFEDTGFDFAYVDDPISPGDWLMADEGWLELEAFGPPGGRAIGLVDIWGPMMSESGEVVDEDYHIRGSFDIPRTDTCP